MNTLAILLVEDDQDLLEAICATMKLAGYQTLAASNGNDAMAALQESQIGMVVSDVQMKPTGPGDKPDSPIRALRADLGASVRG